jgi:hypothetical protein
MDATFNTSQIFNVAITLPENQTTPTRIDVLAKVGNVSMGTPVSFTPGSNGAGTEIVLGVKMDLWQLWTGVYPLEIDVTAVFPNNKFAKAKVEDKLVLINLKSSPYGAFRFPAFLNRLYPVSATSGGGSGGGNNYGGGNSPANAGGVGLVMGNNTTWWFQQDGAGYKSPDGNSS